MKIITLIITMMLAAMLATTALAEDRGGASFSIAVGYAGNSGWQQDYQRYYNEDEDWTDAVVRGGSYDLKLSSGPVYEFKLGAYVNRHSLVYGAFGQSYFEQDGGALDKRLSYGGVGFSYYLFADAPSPYIETTCYYGTINFGTDNTGVEGGENGQRGFGYLVALGYEINSHLQMAAFYNYLGTDNKTFSNSSDLVGSYYHINNYGMRLEYKLSFLR